MKRSHWKNSRFRKEKRGDGLACDGDDENGTDESCQAQIDVEGH